MTKVELKIIKKLIKHIKKEGCLDFGDSGYEDCGNYTNEECQICKQITKIIKKRNKWQTT